MATKAELKEQIEALQAEIEILKSGSNEKAGTPKEPTVCLYWTGTYETVDGSPVTAFGYELQEDEDGVIYAEVPESEVEALLDRPNSLFSEETVVDDEADITPEEEEEVED
jgi:hypothetical protein